MEWFNILKLWTFATQPDAVSRRNRGRSLPSAGVTSPDAIPDIRADGSFWGGGRGQVIRLRDSTDFIDLSSVTNRQSRYKEYERLRSTVEIETAMDVYSDEMCVSGDTVVMTPTGPVTIAKLAETRKPEELFMVYSYDFGKKDFGIGWAFNPRKIGTKKTVQIVLSDGSTLTCTPDHKVLLKDETWVEAGQLKPKDEMMAFYRIRPKMCARVAERHVEYRPVRVFTLNEGFKNERQMIDEFRTGKKTHHGERVDSILKCIQSGLTTRQTASFMGIRWSSLDEYMEAEGLSHKTAKKLHERYPESKRVISVDAGPEVDVYDMSVKEHRNFCTDSAVVHNCQIGDNGHVFDIKVKDPDVKEELEHLFFHPEMLNVDRNMFSWCKNLLIFGDYFFELVMDPENPQDGIVRIQPLPADSVYRIETIKGKLIEFQQAKSGPDYEALSKVEVTRATDFDLMQSTAIRFAPQQIVHIRIGDERRMFYPYGVSLIEPARGPAHLLRLMEDSMVVYRLSRAPERRVFYVDVGGLPPFKAEMVMQRLQDTLRKKKTFNNKASGGSNGAPGVEEKFQPIGQDEDLFIPIRPNVNTRVETLPGASNLGEIDDALYFRNKVFLALKFPKWYMAQDDPTTTRDKLSALSMTLCNHVKRLQNHVADGMTQIAVRHLELRGYPAELYDDLQIQFTEPYPLRDVVLNDIRDAKYNRAMALMQAKIFSHYDVLTKILEMPENEAKEIVARVNAQNMTDLRMQMMAANPESMGVVAKQPGGPEMGTDAAGPSPDLGGMGGEQAGGMGGAQPMGDQQPPGGGAAGGPNVTASMEAPQQGTNAEDTYGNPPQPETFKFSEPSEEDIKRFDLSIIDYSSGIDSEDIDVGELDDESF